MPVEEFSDKRLRELGRFVLRVEAGLEGAVGEASSHPWEPRLTPLGPLAAALVAAFLAASDTGSEGSGSTRGTGS